MERHDDSMYDRLRAVEIATARIETKLDGIFEALTTRMTENKELELRVIELEARVNRAAGMALVGGGILGALSSWIMQAMP